MEKKKKKKGREDERKRLPGLTERSSTVGMKSYPMPSTSYCVLFVLLSSSGSARMEPSGSTATICGQHGPRVRRRGAQRAVGMVRREASVRTRPTLMLGHLSFSLRATPVMVPPVPAPATSMSSFPLRGRSKEQIQVYSAD